MKKDALQQDIKDIIGKSLGYIQEGRIMYLIDELYDDFNSRTCENCKHFNSVFNKVENKNKEFCANKKSLMFRVFKNEGVLKKFGCNKFEIKNK